MRYSLQYEYSGTIRYSNILRSNSSCTTQIHDYKQRADQYMARPGMCEGATTAEAAEQGGGRGVGLGGVPRHGGS